MEIDRSSLAVVQAVAREKSRYAINHLHITSDGTAVATDGRMLMSVEPPDSGEGGGALPREGVLIPADAAKRLEKQLRTQKADSARVVACSATDGKGGPTLTVEANGNGSVAREQIALGDGTFPDYRAVLPKIGRQTVRVCLDLALLRRLVTAFEKAAKDSGVASPNIELLVSPGNKPVLARCRLGEENRRALGLIMPVTNGDDEMWKPSEWERRHWGLKAPGVRGNGKSDGGSQRKKKPETESDAGDTDKDSPTPRKPARKPGRKKAVAKRTRPDPKPSRSIRPERPPKKARRHQTPVAAFPEFTIG